ncbi:hypothetical protein LJC01_01085 [Clostridiaceae bacterium OttesenSCG-928-D20]|nr:hypothetical protein [Clostridiaceae bacterium OttesenSCG-928-D20]
MSKKKKQRSDEMNFPPPPPDFNQNPINMPQENQDNLQEQYQYTSVNNQVAQFVSYDDIKDYLRGLEFTRVVMGVREDEVYSAMQHMDVLYRAKIDKLMESVSGTVEIMQSLENELSIAQQSFLEAEEQLNQYESGLGDQIKELEEKLAEAEAAKKAAEDKLSELEKETEDKIRRLERDLEDARRGLPVSGTMAMGGNEAALNDRIRLLERELEEERRRRTESQSGTGAVDYAAQDRIRSLETELDAERRRRMELEARPVGSVDYASQDRIRNLEAELDSERRRRLELETTRPKATDFASLERIKALEAELDDERQKRIYAESKLAGADFNTVDKIRSLERELEIEKQLHINEIAKLMEPNQEAEIKIKSLERELSIERERRITAEAKLKELSLGKVDYDLMSDQLSSTMVGIREDRKRILDEARLEADRIIAAAREQARRNEDKKRAAELYSEGLKASSVAEFERIKDMFSSISRAAEIARTEAEENISAIYGSKDYNASEMYDEETTFTPGKHRD